MLKVVSGEGGASMILGLRGAVLAAVVVLLTASAAGADTPVHFTDFEEDDVFLTDCGDFDLRDHFTFDADVTVFTNDAGDPTRIVEHVGGSDTFYNSVTGESVTGTINAGEIVDLVGGTVTESGSVGRITVPGLGVVFFDVGKFVIDFDQGLVFLAGSHHAYFEEDYAALCELLA
jgi:hypothetical protein